MHFYDRFADLVYHEEPLNAIIYIHPERHIIFCSFINKMKKKVEKNKRKIYVSMSSEFLLLLYNPLKF